MVLNIVVVAMVSLSLLQSRDVYNERAKVNTQNLARVLDENISGVFFKIDVALQGVCDEYERQLAGGHVDHASLSRFIVRQHTRLPELLALRATDPAGLAIYGPEVTPATTKSLAHRDYFVHLRRTPGAGLVISKPLVGGISGKWMIILARRVNRPDGSFAGLVYAGVGLDYLSHSFSTLNVGKNGFLALVASDLSIVARYPKLKAPPGGTEVGTVFPQFRELLAAGQSTGTYHARSSVDPMERVFSYRKIALTQPLYVFVALSTADYLANWYTELYSGIFFVLIFMIITTALTHVFNREWDRSREAEQALKMMEDERLKMEKLESLGTLAGGIAHDFNNILTGIMGNLSFARMHLDPDHRSQPLLEAAEKASLRAGDLAKQLLTFARGGAPVMEETSVSLLVEEAVSLTLSGSNVKGIVDVPASLNAVEADAGQLCQAFNNIIRNAMEAMPGGGMLVITARDHFLEANNWQKLPPGPYVSVSFSDEGTGIPEQDLKKIFDPYFTTKPHGKGLGLASVYSIVKRHGGNVSVDSRVGEGTTFTVYLPSLGKSCETRTAREVQQGSNAGLSLLVMDDEEAIRQMAEGVLRHMGHRVVTCADGGDAVALYREAMQAGDGFSAVLADLTIPGGMGGMEVARQILSLDPKARLVVMSGYSDDPVMANYRDYGFAKALPKPFDAKAMASLIETLR
ncbi:response regulator [Geomonas sp. Red69]|uniref:hybrid sensor histidine kinase/response regulator n=1 Tax=Geomonas diazotrophica TaxID=2843197 RepID=UPI001C102C21|nr:hybrid sensor histidine kinase/response regulator [Geomonas diazotrophica]MBU5638959.1 response regulator [Geomonas diazotrophica]